MARFGWILVGAALFAQLASISRRAACVPACNPPCAEDEICTEDRMCARPSELASRASVRRHDGFYLRIGLGAGYLSGDVENWDQDGAFGSGAPNRPTAGSVAGLAQLGELLLGGTVADGLVVGGGSWGVNALSPAYEGTGRDLVTDEFGETSVDLTLTSASQLGPFLLYYPDPSEGLHALAAPALTFSLLGGNAHDVQYDVDGALGIGWGIVLGAGYDFWIGEQWSLGIAARFQYFSTTLGATDPESTFSAIVPGLLATATWH